MDPINETCQIIKDKGYKGITIEASTGNNC